MLPLYMGYLSYETSDFNDEFRGFAAIPPTAHPIRTVCGSSILLLQHQLPEYKAHLLCWELSSCRGSKHQDSG